MDEMIYNRATLDGARKCVGMSVVFIGNDEVNAGVGKITSVDENSMCFMIKLNNDNCTYQIPFDLVMYHKASEFKEWILESIYDSIAAEYGLPPVSEMILAYEANKIEKVEQREEKKKMQEEKKAAKAAKEEAKKERAAKKAEKAAKAAKGEGYVEYVIVVCKKNPETKKAEYSRVPAKSANIAIGTAKTLLSDADVTSVQILVKK